MTKLRDHKGTLEDAMQTVREIQTFGDLMKDINANLSPYVGLIAAERVSVNRYYFDDRIKWDTHIVTIAGYGVYGFTDGPVEEAP